VTSLDLLSKYLLIVELRIDVILYLTWGIKILMRAMTNVHAGRRFPTPVLKAGCNKKPPSLIVR